MTWRPGKRLHAEIAEIADSQGISKSAFVRRAVIEAIEHEENRLESASE